MLWLIFPAFAERGGANFKKGQDRSFFLGKIVVEIGEILRALSLLDWVGMIYVICISPSL
jgi:hypothetical protein